MQVQSLSQKDALRKEMATHSSIVAWKIPRSEETGWLQSIGLQSEVTEQASSNYKGALGLGIYPIQLQQEFTSLT